jgi:hypothetical protein
VAASTAKRVRQASARLTTEAVGRMTEVAWFASLPADERSYVGLVVQAGLDEFASWLCDPSRPPKADPSIFSVAPKALVRAVSLQQTVQLIRVTVEVLESAIPSVTASPSEADELEHAVLRYSREVAFAAAEVYAAAAEERGAWDARTEAGVVAALVRGDVSEHVLTRAAALGWTRPEWVAVLVGRLPAEENSRIAEMRAGARRSGMCILVGEYGGQLLVVAGGAGPVEFSVQEVSAGFPPGPVILGHIVPELAMVAEPLAEARAALVAVAAWPEAPRPVDSAALLAERVVLGDDTASRRLLAEVYQPLTDRPDLLITASAYLDEGGTVEATARRLFLHANTVRYRLRRIQATTGRDLTAPRDAVEVRLALVLGRAAV